MVTASGGSIMNIGQGNSGSRAGSGGRGRLVTIFGGSGFVGRHTVRAFARQGWRIRVAVRRPDLAGHLQPMGSVGQIVPVQANVRYPASIAAAVEGADVVVNLVAIMTKSGKQTYKAVHVEGARAVAKAAREAGAAQLIHVSALGAGARSNSGYARSKAAGEAVTLEEFSGAFILRPSLIFGPEDQFFNRFGAMAQLLPFLPLIGGGKTRFQPIYVGDVANAIMAAAQGRAKPGLTYELGGPDIFTFRELLDKTLAWSGRNRGYFRMPFWFAKLVALITWPLPNAWRPLTVDQVRLLRNDTVVSKAAIDEGRTLAALGIEHPHAVNILVPAYLERFHPKGQYSQYRG